MLLRCHGQDAVSWNGVLTKGAGGHLQQLRHIGAADGHLVTQGDRRGCAEEMCPVRKTVSQDAQRNGADA